MASGSRLSWPVQGLILGILSGALVVPLEYFLLVWFPGHWTSPPLAWLLDAQLALGRGLAGAGLPHPLVVPENGVFSGMVTWAVSGYVLFLPIAALTGLGAGWVRSRGRGAGRSGRSGG